jgi:hypothetical protein
LELRIDTKPSQIFVAAFQETYCAPEISICTDDMTKLLAGEHQLTETFPLAPRAEMAKNIEEDIVGTRQDGMIAITNWCRIILGIHIILGVPII